MLSSLLPPPTLSFLHSAPCANSLCKEMRQEPEWREERREFIVGCSGVLPGVTVDETEGAGQLLGPWERGAHVI